MADVESEQNGPSSGAHTLIVNYLPQTLTQPELHSLFSTIGDVESSKLVRDKTTGLSLGYGFVNFTKQEDAEKAIEKLNGLPIQHKKIKVSYARPSSDDIKGANLYVSGLPNIMTQEEFDNIFSQYGRIISSRLLTDKFSGATPSKGVGFIRFDKRSEAEAAIKNMNGKTLEGSTTTVAVKFANTPNNVSHALPQHPSYFQQQQFQGPLYQAGRPSRYSPMVAPKLMINDSFRGRPIFVYNLAPDSDESILWRLFGPFGAVQNVKLIRDPKTNVCKGFGFVNMPNYEEAVMAIQSLDGYSLGERILQVSFKTGNVKNY